MIKKKNIVIILQARMGASRLPGKPLKKVLNKTLLSYQLERLGRVHFADKIVVATTINPQDNEIAALCEKEKISCYRGNEQDVLDRFYQAATLYKADIIVRVTGDCPLIDPEIVDQVIHYYTDARPKYDYVSNSLERTYPRGLDVEVFSFDLLKKAAKEATLEEEHEHVTPYFYTHPHLFSLGSVKQVENQSHHRWTVDTVEDLELIKKILTTLYPQNPLFNQEDVLRVLEKQPEWVKINAHIQQKPLKPSLPKK